MAGVQQREAASLDLRTLRTGPYPPDLSPAAKTVPGAPPNPAPVLQLAPSAETPNCRAVGLKTGSWLRDAPRDINAGPHWAIRPSRASRPPIGPTEKQLPGCRPTSWPLPSRCSKPWRHNRGPGSHASRDQEHQIHPRATNPVAGGSRPRRRRRTPNPGASPKHRLDQPLPWPVVLRACTPHRDGQPSTTADAKSQHVVPQPGSSQTPHSCSTLGTGVNTTDKLPSTRSQPVPRTNSP